MTKPLINNNKSKDILRALMTPSQPDMVPWLSKDLRAILEHQLTTTLGSELDYLVEISHLSREQVSSILKGIEHRTFGNLLQDISPSIQVMRLIKEFGKASMMGNGDLPRDVARVLYVLAILRGRQAGVRNISMLDEASLEHEVRRCLTFGWLPDYVRDLLRTSLSGLHSP